MSLDLHTGRTVWCLKDGNPPVYPKLNENIFAEICIIGGGISGALLAYTLTKKGHQVVLVDERKISTGSTMASTAILSYETDVMLTDLIKDIGKEKAVRVFTAGNRALDAIEQIITNSLPDMCGFRRCDSVYLASKKSAAEDIYQEYLIRKENGFALDFLPEETVSTLFPFNAPAALRTPNMAQVDPVKMTRNLIGYAQTKGLKVFAQTKVRETNYDASDKKTTVIMENGFAILCRNVVYASGYQTQQILKQKRVKLTSSYAIASEPVPALMGWHGKATIWESARPYLYLRTTDDNRIVAGGEDEPFKNEARRDMLIEEKATILMKKVKEKFPDIPFALAAAWAGTFAESADGLPYIGPHPDYPCSYFALGYGGNGITFSAIASSIIPDLIEGRKNADADIFKFGR